MITERQSDILKMIVEEYIRSVKPIGSKAICDTLDCSSATVRNEMVELEELGYLEKTHISSGRIPSEKGYRYYVDNLMEPKNMNGEEILKLQTIFKNNELVLSDAISKSMEIISEMTAYTSIVLGNSSLNNKLKKVEVVPIGDYDLVALVVTNMGHVENKQIKISENISVDEVKKMVDLINSLLVGTPIGEVSQKLEYEIKPIIDKYIKQHEAIYNVFYNAFNEITEKGNMYSFAGKTNIFKLPEFNDTNKLRNIADKFEDKELINSIEETKDGINVYIGNENNIDSDVTVIKTKYNVNGEEGTLAIIGPKRMEYDKVVGMLEYIKKEIER